VKHRSIVMAFVVTLLIAIRFATTVDAGSVENSCVRVQIARDGTTDWCVSMPQTVGPMEQFACGEFERYFGKMCGAKLKRSNNLHKSRSIRIGLREAFQDEMALTSPPSGYDGYIIDVSPDSIIIAGNNDRGVLYGVYDVLERLGCRWYYPSLDPRDPEVVPRKADLSLPVGSWSESSPIEFRIYNGSALFFEIIPERLLPQIDWAAKNRYNVLSWQAHHGPGRVASEIEQMAGCGALDEMTKRGQMLHGPGHSFPFFLSTEEYYDDHPEWFGLAP